MSRKPLLVTAAIILHPQNETVLIAQRRRDAKVEAGLWEFPGGKVEFAEKPQEALRREILEELGLEISVTEIFDVVSHVYRAHSEDADDLHIVLLCYICELTGGALQTLQVQDAKWVAPHELSLFQYAAADVPVVEKLARSLLRKKLKNP